MKTRLPLTLLALVVLFAAPVAALDGYYESFQDTNDATTPTGEPTAWYTYAGAGFQRTPEGWEACTLTGFTCGGGTGAATFTLATPVTISDYDMEITLQLTRQTNSPAHAPSLSFGFNNAGGTQRTFGRLDINNPANTVTITEFASSFCTDADTIAGAASTTVGATFHVHYVASTTTATVTSNYGGCSGVSAVLGDVAVLRFDIGGLYTGTTGLRDIAVMQYVIWNPAGNGATYTLADPDVPDGVSAFVKTARPVAECSGGTPGEIEIRWPISDNDPDRDTGSFTYTYYVNGSPFTDATTSSDGSGQRFALLTFTCTLAGADIAFWVTATDRGVVSSASCIATVNAANQNQVGTCGNPGPGPSETEGDGGIGGGTGNPIRQAADFFASAWNLGADATNWLFGILILTITIIGFARISLHPLLLGLGLLLGTGLSVALGFLSVWFLFVEIFLVIAFASFRVFGDGGEANE